MEHGLEKRRDAVRRCVEAAEMSIPFSNSLGRAAPTRLTTDFWLPGAPQRAVLLCAFRDFRAGSEADGPRTQVRGAIRSALCTLRSEFPTACADAKVCR